MYCFHQYLSIDPKKVCHPHFNVHKTAHKHKLQEISRDISETIKDTELGSQIVRSICLLREYATPTITLTNRPTLWRPQFVF